MPCSASRSSIRGPVAPAWMRAAHDAGPAAVGRDREVLGVRPLQRLEQLGLVARAHDVIGQRRELPAERARDVEIGRPVGVEGPVVVAARRRGPHELGGAEPELRASSAAPSPT